MALSYRTYLEGAPKPRGVSNADLKLLLWPVHAWEVYVSNPNGRRLNLFEKSILELYRVSNERVLSTSDIADWFGLEEEMVQYIIISVLIPNGWLDEKGHVTQKGELLLEDEVSDDVTSSQVYQCGITGEWLPRLGFELLKRTPEKSKKGLLFRLDRASDRYEIGFELKTKTLTPTEPGNDNLMDIARQYKDSLIVAKNTRDDFDDDMSKFYADSIQGSEAKSKLVYIMVWAEQVYGYGWKVYDPFGVSAHATWMTSLFEQACALDSNFAAHVLRNMDTNDEEATYEETVIQMREKALFEIMATYPGVSQIPGLQQPLFDLIQQKELVELSENNDYHHYKSLMISSGVALEFVCKWLVENYPIKRMHKLPAWRDDDDTKRRILRELLICSGLNNIQREAALKVRPSSVYAAAKGKNSSCRALLITMFISFDDYPAHPMKKLLDKTALFSQIYQLSHDRDKAAHGERDEKGNIHKFSKVESLAAAKTLDKFLKILFRGIEYCG